jgi:hypothetical protein
MAIIKITQLDILIERLRVAHVELVRLDLWDPDGYFPEARRAAQLELRNIAAEAKRAGFSYEEMLAQIVSGEEARADFEAEP